MAALLRPFLALMLAVTLLGATALAASASLTGEIAAAGPCCKGECPDHPACDASCTMMQRCGTGMAALLQASEPKVPAAPGVATLSRHEPSPPMRLAPRGPERPPRL